MSATITDYHLFQFLVAVILRNNGYIAGVPRRHMGGRGTQHQVNVIAVDLNNSPFSFNNVLLIEGISHNNTTNCNHINIVKNLKATLLDLEQTLPPNKQLIREIAAANRGDLFHRIYGNRKDKETLTVNYVGAVFYTGEFTPCAREYAHAHGIHTIYTPHCLGGQSIVGWNRAIRKYFSTILDQEGQFTLRGLQKKTNKYQDFCHILTKLHSRSYNLMPHENHDLFTIYNEVIKQPEFDKLTRHLKKITLASVNGSPVLLDYNLPYRNLITAVLQSYEDKTSHGRAIDQQTKFKPLNTINLEVIDCKTTRDKNVLEFQYTTGTQKVPEVIKDLSGSVYIPLTALDCRTKRFRLKLPLKAGLSLIFEFNIEGINLKEIKV
ncbi:hypothetical protein [Desulfolucanica intricata]|uniref:hypothetical protein n=1 Tax=Desulfolucanica intricata TaxID=1285191 RepID=UPI0008301642|nr:hypothetical protein [Desulfolucanica intricata]